MQNKLQFSTLKSIRHVKIFNILSKVWDWNLLFKKLDSLNSFFAVSQHWFYCLSNLYINKWKSKLYFSSENSNNMDYNFDWILLIIDPVCFRLLPGLTSPQAMYGAGAQTLNPLDSELSNHYDSRFSSLDIIVPLLHLVYIF